MEQVSYPAIIAFVFLALSGLVLLIVRGRRKSDKMSGDTLHEDKNAGAD